MAEPAQNLMAETNGEGAADGRVDPGLAREGAPREGGTAQTGEGGGHRSHVIVFGNEKGGTGKTTAAMHVAIALIKQGGRVAAIDLDSRQRTLARYIENRAAFTARTGHALSVPSMIVVEKSQADNALDAAGDEAMRLDDAVARARAAADFVIIDTPGADTALSRAGHAAADTLVTPMNDSFVDFDLLARINPETLEILGPSLYSEFVWECRKRRLVQKKPQLDWLVMRTRLATTEARNKKRIAEAVAALSARIGFRIAPGFSERVIFRELFTFGLTLFDLPAPGVNISLTMSHIAARQEIRELIAALKLPMQSAAAAA
jgi:chromosome partitioning protein